MLAWSQDVTPQRWLWTKLAILGAVTAAAGTAVSAAAGHMAAAVSIATGQSLFSGNAFLVTGMLPLVQTVVWLAVGVALGAAVVAGPPHEHERRLASARPGYFSTMKYCQPLSALRLLASEPRL